VQSLVYIKMPEAASVAAPQACPKASSEQSNVCISRLPGDGEHGASRRLQRDAATGPSPLFLFSAAATEFVPGRSPPATAGTQSSSFSWNTAASIFQMPESPAGSALAAPRSPSSQAAKVPTTGAATNPSSSGDIRHTVSLADAVGPSSRVMQPMPQSPNLGPYDSPEAVSKEPSLPLGELEDKEQEMHYEEFGQDKLVVGEGITEEKKTWAEMARESSKKTIPRSAKEFPSQSASIPKALVMGEQVAKSAVVQPDETTVSTIDDIYADGKTRRIIASYSPPRVSITALRAAYESPPKPSASEKASGEKTGGDMHVQNGSVITAHGAAQERESPEGEAAQEPASWAARMRTGAARSRTLGSQSLPKQTVAGSTQKLTPSLGSKNIQAEKREAACSSGIAPKASAPILVPGICGREGAAPFSALTEGDDEEDLEIKTENSQDVDVFAASAHRCSTNEAVADGLERTLKDEEENQEKDERKEQADTQCDHDAHYEAEDDVGTAQGEQANEQDQPGLPGKDGVIKYSLDFLKGMASSPDSQGTCPPSVPVSIRVPEAFESITKDERPLGNRPHKRYKMEFLRQFQDKPSCREAPKNARIPKDICASSGDSPFAAETHGGAVGSRAPVIPEDEDWRAAQLKQSASQPHRSVRMTEVKSSRGRDRKAEKWREEDLPKLGSSESSWAARQQAVKQQGKNQCSDEAIFRKMKAILNKLTMEKFDALYEKLLECGIRTSTHIEMLMREVFEKATTQHHFIEMYTRLCLRLHDRFDVRRAGCEEVSFKRILLNLCQDSFETYLKPPDALQELTGDERFEAQTKYKTQMLGNMKFVGQLLIDKLVSTRIISRCIEELLSARSEETLETLCVFLTTIGPAFDTKDWIKSQETFAEVFDKVKELSTTTKVQIPARTRCLLKDVLDLRANGWDKSVRPTRNDGGPMTISEVQTQWARDNLQHDKSLKGGGKGGSRGAGGDTSFFGRQVSVDDEWETVPSRGASRKEEAGSKSSPSGPRNSDRDRLGKQPVLQRANTSHNASSKRHKTPQAKEDAPLLLWRTKSAPVSSLTADAAIVASLAPATGTSNGERGQLQLRGLIAELALSHDTEEAIIRMRDLQDIEGHQKDLVSRMASQIAEGRSEDRAILWRFLLRIFTEDIFQRDALVTGLELFFCNVFEDLKMDVPLAPAIIDELFGLLSSDGLELISAHELAKFRAKLGSAP